ncbi:binding protein [Arabidopsis lyrata subsp. lyrata]|uniref:Binding protein n=1 Tax=Arabidopsis lyrata subsp. lyrata TaxID=81972 RepID=D7LVD5_ARALL|nr:binding protein [Arabidopsis lyrata subsp. lyrata]
MRILAARIANHFCRARNAYQPRSRNFSSLNKKDDLTLEEEAERKIGWCLKIFFAGTATYIGYQFFPYLGDNLIHQSISLLHVKDPLFKRMGASRLSRFAIDDERRMKVVEMGGAQELLLMLGSAKDDKTRKEALKALAALSKSGQSYEAANFLGSNGALSIVKSTPDSLEDSDISTYKSNILEKLHEKNLAVSSN